MRKTVKGVNEFQMYSGFLLAFINLLGNNDKTFFATIMKESNGTIAFLETIKTDERCNVIT